MFATRDEALAGLDRYQYEPLETATSIRLLELLPGFTESRIKCGLRNVNLEDCRTYRALSYVWGTGFVSVGCVDNDNSDIGCVAISHNLRDLLQHIRSDTDSVFLWADAICINQHNDAERGHQVKQMRNIYATAKEVMVWLGREDGETELALETIAEIGKHCIQLSLQEVKAITTMGQLAELLNVASLPSLGEEPARVAARLFTRPWFERVWVIQEVNAGPEVLVNIGHQTIPWNLIGITAHWLREARWASSATGEGTEVMRNAVSMWQGRFNSQESAAFLLDESRDYGATDPRDKVYALLGFPSMQKEVPMLPVYDGKTTADVYKELVPVHIRATGKVTMLCYVEHPPNVEDRFGAKDEDVETWPDLPSWAPNWSEQTYFPLSSLDSIGTYRKTLDHTQTQVEVSDDGGLSLRGRVIGTVAAVARYVRWKHIHETPHIENPDAIADFWQTMQDLSAPMGDVHLRLSLAQAMTAGIDAEYQAVASQAVRHQRDFVKFMSDTLDDHKIDRPLNDPTDDCQSKLSSLLQDTPVSSGNGSRYLQACYLTTPHRRLFCNEKGIAGLGHSQILPGDTIVAFFGSNMPFILRPREKGYRLVGECYLYGMMDGAAFQGTGSSGTVIRTFELH